LVDALPGIWRRGRTKSAFLTTAKLSRWALTRSCLRRPTADTRGSSTLRRCDCRCRNADTMLVYQNALVAQLIETAHLYVNDLSDSNRRCSKEAYELPLRSAEAATHAERVRHWGMKSSDSANGGCSPIRVGVSNDRAELEILN
jgi:hypothetical protein